jgi:hypothetical protein
MTISRDGLQTSSKPELEQLISQLADKELSISDLQRQLDVLKEERDLIQRQLNHRLNADTLISRLPVETLGQIFTFYLLGRPKYIRRLLLVCRRWYEVVMAHRNLWTDIRFHSSYVQIEGLLDGDLRFVDVCYERSGSLGLNVTFDMSAFIAISFEDSADGLNVAWSVLKGLVGRDITRWRSFHLNWPNALDMTEHCYNFDSDILDSVIKNGINLEYVSIDNAGWEFTGELELQPVGSNLRTLRLCDMDWNWEWDFQGGDLFPQLKSLVVERGQDRHWEPITASQGCWLQIFPQLEELTIRNGSPCGYKFQSYTHQPGANCRAAPSIRKLHLIGHLPRDLLRTLNLPSLETLTLQSNNSNAHSSVGATVLPFASGVHTLIMRDNEESAQVASGNVYKLEALKRLIDSLTRLSTIAMEKTLWHRLSDGHDKIPKLPAVLDGNDAYYFDLAALRANLS